MRILAVDDDLIILELLKEILGAAGHQHVSVADSAEQALTILKTTPESFDCFLLDIQMPGMDGVELCQRIRRMPQYARTPILMLTAMSEKSYIDRSFAAGATDYITKPFEVAEVQARLGTAEQIVEERRRNIEQALALQSLQKESDARDPNLLREPVFIPDVDGLIDHLAFENYLLQLGRVRQFMTVVIAVKIVNITEIFENCTARNFRYFLADMADALSDSLRRMGFLMAYRGAGVFVIAVDRLVAENARQDLRNNLSIVLSEMTPVYDGGQPIEINAVIGEPSYPGLVRNRDALAPIRMSIKNAEMKALQLSSRFSPEVNHDPLSADPHTRRRDPAIVAW